MKESNKPIKTFRAGCVSASIWKKEVKKDKKVLTFYNVSIERSYKDEESDEWKSTDSYSLYDLPKVTLVSNLAYEYIITKAYDTDYFKEE